MNRNTRRTIAGMTAVFVLNTAAPLGARADDSTGCSALAQASAAGLAAAINADDQTIRAPESVTQLSCLDNFFKGAGLNVITSLLDPTQLLKNVEGQICNSVNSAWQSAIGSAECGLTVTGFNMNFGLDLGGGTFCPKLSFGGGGTTISSIGTAPAGNQGLYLNGTNQYPTGYSPVAAQ